MKMCDALVCQGHELVLLARSGEEELASPFHFYGLKSTFRIEYLKWSKWRYGGIGYALRCFRFLRSLPDVDVVYGRSVYGLLAARALGLPYGLEVHSFPHTRLRMHLERYLLGRSGVLVATSTRLRDEYEARFGERLPAQVMVEPNATDGVGSRCDQVLDSWCGRDDALQIGYVGHLYPGRGIELLVELARRLPQMDFHIIGGTPQDIRKWRRTSASPNLHFHGFVEPRLVDRYRGMCDVLVLPYQQKVAVAGGTGDDSQWMCPLKLRESMAAGKAIVASDLPPLAEMLTDARSALLVAPADVDGWVLALRSLEQDVELRRRLGQCAKLAIAEEQTWDARARRVAEALAGLPGSRRQRNLRS
ncbi:glycosyltransferase family 4 protein [Candidatus Bipolaricaulota bacterium]